jgi:hypothetical protein
MQYKKKEINKASTFNRLLHMDDMYMYEEKEFKVVPYTSGKI